MQKNEKPREHLRLAIDLVQAMEQSTNIHDLEKHWIAFLHSVERSWNKAIAHYGRSPKWSGWKAKYLSARENDPLLAYVRRARDADEHTVAEILEKQYGSYELKAADPSRGVWLSGRLGPNGFTPSLTGRNENWRQEIRPASLRLLPITNRGKVYPVPNVHLGVPLATDHPAYIAKLATDYYLKFLDAADEFFLK